MIVSSEQAIHRDIPNEERLKIGERILQPQLHEDPVAIHQAIMLGTLNAYREFRRLSPDITIPHKLPIILNHMMQVNTVTASLMDGVQHKPDGLSYTQEEKRETKRQAAIYSGIHDIGRILDIPDLPDIKKSDQHAWNGQFLLAKLLPGSMKYGRGSYERFAYGHHNSGLYMDFAIPAIEIIHRGRNDAENIAKKEGITDEKEINRRVAIGQDNAMDYVISLYDEEFGVAGMTALIADLSKAYPDLEDKHRSVIDSFTHEKVEALMERQINHVKSYERDSARHINERIGSRFILKLITYVETAYGIDYLKAIEDAKNKWDEYVVDSLNREWSDLIQQQTTEDVAVA